MTNAKSKREDMIDRAATHARVAGRQAIMKGLDPSNAGVTLMAESFVLIYGIEIERALDLVKYVNAYAAEILQSQILDECASTHTEAEMDALRQQARDGQNSLNTPPVIRNLVPKAVEQAQLMGAMPLPPNDWATVKCPVCGR